MAAPRTETPPNRPLPPFVFYGMFPVAENGIAPRALANLRQDVDQLAATHAARGAYVVRDKIRDAFATLARRLGPDTPKMAFKFLGYTGGRTTTFRLELGPPENVPTA